MEKQLADIKHQFFAYRNGIIADALRSQASPHSQIFGLNVPQLAEIARGLTADEDLARRLWADSLCRESRLLACYLFPSDTDTTSIIEGYELAPGIMSPEEADMLSFRLLKRREDAAEIVEHYSNSDNPLLRYLSKVLARHIAP